MTAENPIGQNPDARLIQADDPQLAVMDAIATPLGQVPDLSVYLREPERSAQGLEVWGCIDKRGPHPEDPVLAGLTYYQMPGGLYGLGKAVGTAMETTKPNSFINQNKQIHQLGKIAGKVLLRNGILVVAHEECAAILNGDAVAETVSEPRADVLEGANKIHPGVDYAQYDNVIDATDRFRKAGVVSPPDEVYRGVKTDCEHGPKFPSAKLIDQEVPEASGFVSILSDKTVFDVEAANRDGYGFYVVTIGAVRRMHKILSNYFPMKQENFEAAIAVHTAAIQAAHILGEDGKQLPIHTIEETAAA